MRNHRITKADFRPCSTCMSRSQAGFCLYTLRLISKQPEPTIARLRYFLGGDRPSQTTRQTLSLSLIQGKRLDAQYKKGGISPLAPPNLTVRFHSLPPILHILHRTPRLSCSKGARGLSVLLRATGIFTGATNSLSLSSRQRPDRYAIRAGRNLPDKEFRYLRTVIVTAAVHRGFGSKLRPCGLTSPLNLPAPGRRQTLYVVLLTLQSPVFLVNSRLGLVSATPFGSAREERHLMRANLLPKLRLQFAEFLNESSLTRLGMLSQSTCVGLRYGHLRPG